MELLLPDCLELGLWSSDLHGNTGSSWVSSLLAFGIECILLALPVLRLSDTNRNYMTALLSATANCRSWDF